MTVKTKAIQFGTPEFEELLSAIREDANRRRKLPVLEHPFYAIQLIKQTRLGALRLPVEQGGGGATIPELFEALIELAAADPDVAHILRSHFSQVETYLMDVESPERTVWLERIAEGVILGNAYTEISKKNVGKLEFNTTLLPDGKDYVLNGSKYYSTGTLYSDYIFVTAADQNHKVVAVIVPADREGVEIVDDWDGFGQRSTGSGTTHFRNVRVTEGEFELMEAKTPFNSYAQLFLQAVIAGITQEIVQDAKKIILSRKRTFTFAVADVPREDPQLQQVIGKLVSNAYAAKAIVLKASHALQRAVDHVQNGEVQVEDSHQAALEAAEAKIIVDELALQSASLLFEVGGSSAVREENHYDRHWRNIRTIASHNPNVYKERLIGDYVLNDRDLPINEVYF